MYVLFDSDITGMGWGETDESFLEEAPYKCDVTIAYLCVNHKNQSPVGAEDDLRVVRKVADVDLTGKVPDLELDERTVRNI